MREIYNLISNYEENAEMLYVMGIDGSIQGKKLLFVNDELTYSTDDSEKLLACKDDFCRTLANGVCSTKEGLTFAERIGMNPRIIICGAGTVGLEVIKLGKQLGYTVIVLEDRKEYADTASAFGADKVICMDFENAFSNIDEKTSDFYIAVTREHKYDKVCLEHILNRKYAYVGMMASKNRAAVLKETLINEGIDSQAVEKIHSPIGLKIKAETPAEIAVSIFAEIIQIKNGMGKSEGFKQELLEEIINADEKMVLATIVKRTGSAPRDVGSKMLIYESGKITGSIGGGWIEANTIKLAKEMFAGGDKSALYETEKNSEEAVLCGGYETIYLEMLT